MKWRIAVVTILLAALAAFFWFVRTPNPASQSETGSTEPSDTHPPGRAELPLAQSNRPAAEAVKLSPGAAASAAAVSPPTWSPPDAAAAPSGLEFTNLPPSIVMDNMRTAIRQYGSMFGGNPVGTNLEIASALNGNNPKQAQLLNPEAGLRLNASGELVDPWGTPFFFHQLSGTEMEIHSAGPDKTLWTTDDLVVK